jgi:mannonate dehydratase
VLRVYGESGFDGPMRPDHAPTMEGESNSNPGYAMIGKILLAAMRRYLLVPKPRFLYPFIVVGG